MEHSKLPYGTDVTRTLIFSGKKIIADTYDSDTVLTNKETAQANAKFIVLACNAHEDLLAACEVSETCFRKLSAIDTLASSKHVLLDNAKLIKAAIAKGTE